MKTVSERLRDRMKTQRVMVSISLRIPENVIEDLKEIAPSLGFTAISPSSRPISAKVCEKICSGSTDLKCRP